MIFVKIVEPGFVLYGCGSFWPGAREGEPPPDHLMLVGTVVCDGPACKCHEARVAAQDP